MRNIIVSCTLLVMGMAQASMPQRCLSPSAVACASLLLPSRRSLSALVPQYEATHLRCLGRRRR